MGQCQSMQGSTSQRTNWVDCNQGLHPHISLHVPFPFIVVLVPQVVLDRRTGLERAVTGASVVGALATLLCMGSMAKGLMS